MNILFYNYMYFLSLLVIIFYGSKNSIIFYFTVFSDVQLLLQGVKINNFPEFF